MAILNRRTDGWYDSPAKELLGQMLLIAPALIALLVGVLLPWIARIWAH